jgi:hypothetical protein
LPAEMLARLDAIALESEGTRKRIERVDNYENESSADW